MPIMSQYFPFSPCNKQVPEINNFKNTTHGFYKAQQSTHFKTESARCIACTDGVLLLRLTG
jgi:hypothetical protein